MVGPPTYTLPVGGPNLGGECVCPFAAVAGKRRRCLHLMRVRRLAMSAHCLLRVKRFSARAADKLLTLRMGLLIVSLQGGCRGKLATAGGTAIGLSLRHFTKPPFSCVLG